MKIAFSEDQLIGIALGNIWYYADVKTNKVLTPDLSPAIVVRIMSHYEHSRYDINANALLTIVNRLSGMGQYKAVEYYNLRST